MKYSLSCQQTLVGMQVKMEFLETNSSYNAWFEFSNGFIIFDHYRFLRISDGLLLTETWAFEKEVFEEVLWELVVFLKTHYPMAKFSVNLNLISQLKGWLEKHNLRYNHHKMCYEGVFETEMSEIILNLPKLLAG